MLIEEFLPVWSFREVHSVDIRGEAAKIICAIKDTKAGELSLVNFLMHIRSLPAFLLLGRRYSPEKDIPMIAQITKSGFILLGENQNEILLGIIGKFWRPSGGLHRDRFSAAGFRNFNEPGWAKAAWDFRVTSKDGICTLSTETRVHATSTKARRRFRLYWYLIRPASGLIRRSLLRHIKSEVESKP